MTITLNGESLVIEAATVTHLLALVLKDARPSGVAVGVNGKVVARDEWPRFHLADGDVVELVTAVQGG